jgi:hypothetical protein
LLARGGDAGADVTEHADWNGTDDQDGKPLPPACEGGISGCLAWPCRLAVDGGVHLQAEERGPDTDGQASPVRHERGVGAAAKPSSVSDVVVRRCLDR